MSFEEKKPTNDFEQGGGESEITGENLDLQNKHSEASEDGNNNEPKPIVEQPYNSQTPNKNSIPTGMIVALVAAVAVAAFFAGSYFSSTDSDMLTRSEFQQAISNLESKIEGNQPASQQAPQPVRISLDDDPMRGDPDAPITIVEFSDFQCPFCARFHVQTLPSIIEEYIAEGKVNLVYRDFPIQSIHPNALPAAVAAECANEQGKYWEYHDTLFEKQNSWNKLDSNSAIATFSQYATDIDLEKEQFDSCLQTGKYLEEVQGDLRDGRDYDITGTPGFFIGNEDIGFVKINGAQPFESFKRVIDAQLAT
jgi:protein-disulfide isomerase